ncbi:pyrE [Symbiodinium necroappetens]|uniref:orotate phosphoribosyltransferase n=1 Tax=Symbiodinium necroappetens TaxID=1628268 RepID=A0A812Y4L0_9DINO|nr:pyrE [Symbiodinium necroappetens]
MSAAADAARTTANILLEIEAVLFRPDAPFTFTSGRKSPVYVDCRKIISFPRARAKLMDLAVERIAASVGYESLDVIAGGETAGIPFAAWIAERLGLPMVYVRKKPKGFGRNAQIEGTFPEGARALLVEDLATDGGSKLGFIEALRGAGAEAAHSFVVFHYGIFPEGIARLEAEGVSLHALCTWYDALAAAEAAGYLSGQGLAEVKAFLDDPDGWQEIVFYTNPQSRGRIVRWMLEEVEAPYRAEYLTYGPALQTPEFLAVNPMGKLPAIRHGGTVVTETVAICSYLADAFPERGLAPPPPARGAYYRWLFFSAGPFDAAITARAAGFEPPEAVRGMIGYGSLERVLDTLERQLSAAPYLAGTDFTTADLCAGAQLVFGQHIEVIAPRPVFTDYLDRLAARPAFRRAAALDEAAQAAMDQQGETREQPA